MSKDDEGSLPPIDEAVVDILLRTDKIVERYKERKRALGEEVDVDQPSMPDRLLLAQIVNQTAMAGAMGVGGGSGLTPDAIFGKLEDLRERLFEECKAHIESIMGAPATAMPPGFDGLALPPVEPPNDEEKSLINAELRALKARDWDALVITDTALAHDLLVKFRVRRAMKEKKDSPFAELEAAATAGVTMPVKLNPAQVHADFEDALFAAGVDMGSAKKTLELLVASGPGNEMLKLMLYDAVGIMRRKRESQPKGG